MIRNNLDKIAVGLILLLTAAGVYSNILQHKAVDQSKLPEKVEENRGFQRWITNLKNKEMDIEADEFRLKEENEIYNTKWMKVYSVDDESAKKAYEETLEEMKDIKKVIFSPSEREFLDYREIERDDYKPNEVRFYGQKDDKIIDARVVDCSTRGNCYFDRAFFLDNDLFVVTEISRTIDKRDQDAPDCLVEEKCEYSFKLHLIDLINNQRLVYESEPFTAILAELKPEL